MNQGKLEVVKKEVARMNINILGINELKWTGMGKSNSDDHYIHYCGQESLRRNGVALIVCIIIYVYICVCMSAYVYIYISICVYMYMSVCISVRVSVYICVCVCVCVCVLGHFSHAFSVTL